MRVSLFASLTLAPGARLQGAIRRQLWRGNQLAERGQLLHCLHWGLGALCGESPDRSGNRHLQGRTVTALRDAQVADLEGAPPHDGHRAPLQRFETVKGGRGRLEGEGEAGGGGRGGRGRERREGEGEEEAGGERGISGCMGGLSGPSTSSSGVELVLLLRIGHLLRLKKCYETRTAERKTIVCLAIFIAFCSGNSTCITSHVNWVEWET